MSSNAKIRVRFAPSPTGSLHVGTARVALFNWLFARQHRGAFVMRIEDTDAARSEDHHEAEIFEALSWLDLIPDESPKAGGEYGPYRQSKRSGIYKKYLESLLKTRHAYYCYCTTEELDAHREAMLAQGLPPKYSGHCRTLTAAPSGRTDSVIRFVTPETRVEFKDIIRGTIRFDTALIGDIVIARTITEPLYNLAVVIDDHEMRISHIIRGEDHVPNTPKQILLQRALAFKEPVYAHLPLVLGPDKKKLSKRYSDTSIMEYRRDGYLPDALVNFLALLGWHPKGNEEIMTREELIRAFELKRVQKAGAVFDEEKLEWLNGQHLKTMSDAELAVRIVEHYHASPSLLPAGEHAIVLNDPFLTRVIALERERMKTINDFFTLAGFFFVLPDYAAELLLWKNESPIKAKRILEEVCATLETISEDGFAKAVLQNALADVLSREGTGPVLWPLRAALSGRSASPDPFDIMEVLGRDESIRRIRVGIDTVAAVIS